MDMMANPLRINMFAPRDDCDSHHYLHWRRVPILFISVYHSASIPIMLYCDDFDQTVTVNDQWEALGSGG